VSAQLAIGRSFITGGKQHWCNGGDRIPIDFDKKMCLSMFCALLVSICCSYNLKFSKKMEPSGIKFITA
jgi:hypothetical protein